ncbi:Uncharacterised protein [Mycobacterium tuberculosis]|uniref:Uncharacterized protein n=1 Tax=Mycobacterium tuberculosis TaxID=1773 RepID=A0A0U0RS06_MYCTX|nr:Uncharacterised protein [Mycobacterium tuberculosis]CNM08750.1 Uncharacterised protein [Mycobacterium tuberculosis]CNM27829.1 Uncharacterised protein [Mycobacterium tuberculosis]COW22242.1 Uncharacterised protein [Mycobacterium tuberculosis]
MRLGHLRRIQRMLEPATTGHVRHHRRGQQRAVLYRIDAPVGEAPLIAQSYHLELDVLGRVTAVDEVHRECAGR